MFKSPFAETVISQSAFRPQWGVMSYSVYVSWHLSKLKNSEFWRISDPRIFKKELFIVVLTLFYRWENQESSAFPKVGRVAVEIQVKNKKGICLSTLFYSPAGQPGLWVGAQDQNSGLWDKGDILRATASFCSNLKAHVSPPHLPAASLAGAAI